MAWYRAVRERPLSAALRYAVLFHLAAAAFASMMLASYVFGAETAFIVHAVRTFPGDAALTVSGGRISTNLAEPFEAGSRKWMRVVIDTSVRGHEIPDAYVDLPGVLIGGDAIFLPKSYAGNSGFVTHRAFLKAEGLPEFTVTRGGLLEWLRVWGGLAAIGGLAALAVVSWPYMLAKTLLAAAAFAATAALIGRCFGVALPYKKWFVMCLYAATLPMALGLAAWAMRFPLPFPSAALIGAFVAAVLADELSRSATRWTPAVLESMFFVPKRERADVPRTERPLRDE